MSRYFKVIPQGIGTTSVECLSSLLHRMARAHGVTRHQFVIHLRQWWAKDKGRHLARCEELRWDGYSPNVEVALDALRDATGQNLEGCTLVALKSVCAANCVGSIRHSRIWCPACYRDDLSSGRSVYDRLLWRLQVSQRCSIHRHTLTMHCPHCGSLQKNDSSYADLNQCSRCLQSLAVSGRAGSHDAKPAFGEAQAEILIRRIDQIGKAAVLPLQRFLGTVDADMNQLASDLGDLFHVRTVPARPQLTSLIAVASYFNVDVVDLITQPEQAAAQAHFDFKQKLPPRRTRPSSLRRQERSEWFEQELIREINGAPPYSSVPAFCKQRDFSQQSARGSFPKLTQQLSLKYFAWKRDQSNARQAKALSSIKSLRHKKKRLTNKEFVRMVAERSGAPIHVVRALVRQESTRLDCTRGPSSRKTSQ